ncbi:MAG: hypothetical protein SFV15_00085 [Polyangiaceae bacterium]|nr:hypothetical protein [Polyangiaceae bacterium]
MQARLGWILGVALLLGACGGESESLPPQLRVQTNFQADPFPNDAAASDRAGPYTAVSSSGDHTCGIRQDGSLWCWGSNSNGQIGAGFTSQVVEQPTRVFGEAGWERVSAGLRHTCGIRQGDVFCWGYNASGQLGDGSRHARLAPTLVAHGNWQDIAVAESNTCAIDGQGKLYCWGYASFALFGNLLEDGQSTVTTPLQVERSRTFRQVVLSAPVDDSIYTAACALEQAGRIACFGVDPGRAAVGERIQQLDTGVDWVELSFERSSPCARKADGSRWCWNGFGFKRVPMEWKSEAAHSGTHFCGVALDGSLWCSGLDDFGQLGNGMSRERSDNPVRVGTGTDWVAVATGLAHSCALNQAGEPWCWGSDSRAQLGTGRARTKVGPQLVGPGWGALSLGGAETCGAQQGQIFCWGRPSLLPDLGVPVGSTGKLLVPGQQIAWRSSGSCILDQGMVDCVDTALPATRLGGPQYRYVAAGDFGTCAIAVDGALYCLGLGEGQMLEPMPVTNDVWQSVSVGRRHACGIAQGNRLLCWGEASYLGLLPPKSEFMPRAVTPERGYVEVAAGMDSSCAIAADQSLWCWGLGYWGALGSGHFKDEPVPVRIGTDQWTQVSVHQHACAIRVDGALFCWGPNASAQLGNEPSPGINVPIQVGTSTDWKQVVVGGRHTCALNMATELYCWGSDSDGQIGVQEAWLGEPARVWPL